MAIPAVGYAIISLGSTLLRVAPKLLKEYTKLGARQVKNPTKAQIKKARPAKDMDKQPKPKKAPRKTKKEQETEDRISDFEADEMKKYEETYEPEHSMDRFYQSGGMIGQSDMSAKKVTAPKKKKSIPQYYKGGGAIKKKYAYGGRVAKYKG